MQTLFRELATENLVPTDWKGENVRIFNPTVIAFDDHYILFYRVVSPKIGRKIAACRLSRELVVLPGSVTPFSDHVLGAPDWQADPRIFILQNGLWISWNTGIIEGQDNEQYLCQFDPGSLLPISVPRTVVTRFARRQVEKNWMFFADDQLHAVYSPQPHTVLTGALEENAVTFDKRVTTYWRPRHSISGLHEPRGGAQPVLHKAEYYHFCHSVRKTPEGFDYIALVYTFSPKEPYCALRFASRPLDLPNPYGTIFRRPKLSDRVRSVVYPTGAVRLPSDDGWLIAYGLNDETCCLATIPDSTIEALLEPVIAVRGWYWMITDRMKKLPSYVRRKFR